MVRKKVLVTGGAGFLGSHLCKSLLDLGYEVYCVDNFLTGSYRNIAPYIDHPHFTYLKHDILDPLHLTVDEIYNLACPASPIHYQSDPILTTKINVIGALNMLELARKNQAKIFQASTSEVYGDPQIHPQTEQYWGNVNPVGYRSCYDEGKRCAETLFFDYFRKHNICIKLARIFNTYGPNMHPQDGRVISNFIVQALLGKPLTIYGDGSQTRSFCYVDDLILGIIQMMQKDQKIGPMNLGNPDEFTIIELAHKILSLTGSESKLVFKSLPFDDPRQRQPEISKAKKELNWSPKIPLEEGLVKTIAYFEELLSKEDQSYTLELAKKI